MNGTLKISTSPGFAAGSKECNGCKYVDNYYDQHRGTIYFCSFPFFGEYESTNLKISGQDEETLKFSFYRLVECVEAEK